MVLMAKTKNSKNRVKHMKQARKLCVQLADDAGGVHEVGADGQPSVRDQSWRLRLAHKPPPFQRKHGLVGVRSESRLPLQSQNRPHCLLQPFYLESPNDKKCHRLDSEDYNQKCLSGVFERQKLSFCQIPQKNADFFGKYGQYTFLMPSITRKKNRSFFYTT